MPKKYVLTEEKLMETLLDAWCAGYDATDTDHNGGYEKPVEVLHDCIRDVYGILNNLDNHVLDY